MGPRLLLLVLVALLTGCAKPPAPVAAEIAWFTGDVTAALEEAKESNRPVFLYWGAVWCPYCQQLKSSVFTRRDFIDKSRLFVPVYLDGDAPGAQQWADRLKVSGYPTVLILRADGTELMRVAGGMDVERYAGILDLALEDTKPVAEIFAGLESAPQPLSRDDCARLAYHGFALDEGFTGDEKRTAALLTLAAAQCPEDAGVERARLQVLAAAAEPTPLYAGPVVRLLGHPELAVAVADTLFALDEDFFAAARVAAVVPDEELKTRWFRTMETAARDSRYSESDQLFALNAHLHGAQAFGSLPPELASAARSHIEEVLARKHDGFTRASVVNAALYVFDALGDDERVYSLAMAELPTATAPYYLMMDLASIDEKRGRTEAALGWLERAYNESRGAATRFQWGTAYVAGLVRMRPDDEAKIREAALSTLNELGPDGLHGRTNARIARLERILKDWNAAGRHQEAVTAIASRMQSLCGAVAEAERVACSSFLESDPA